MKKNKNKRQKIIQKGKVYYINIKTKKQKTNRNTTKETNKQLTKTKKNNQQHI